MAPQAGDSTAASGAVRRGSAVEVAVARRALLEPEAVVVRGVLEELGGLLQHVLAVVLAGGRLGGGSTRVGEAPPGVLFGKAPLDVMPAGGVLGRGDVDGLHDLRAVGIVLLVGERVVVDKALLCEGFVAVELVVVEVFVVRD